MTTVLGMVGIFVFNLAYGLWMADGDRRLKRLVYFGQSLLAVVFVIALVQRA